MVAALTYVVGWASDLYGLNQSLESQAIRYRAIRKELGQSEPKIAELDSLFSAEDSDDCIRQLRQQVFAYEAPPPPRRAITQTATGISPKEPEIASCASLH